MIFIYLIFKTEYLRPKNEDPVRKRLEHDSRPKQKQETTRYAVFIEFDQGLRFAHNPTKSTKRRPRQY